MPSGAIAQDLKRLTSYRALAALVVFLYHLRIRGGTLGPANNAWQWGYTSVAFFFILSGFVLAWSYKTGPGTTGSFYLRRFARIYPSHLVMLVVVLIIPITLLPVTAPQIVGNAFLVQSWFPADFDVYSLNGAAWSLSCEVAFYLTLPLVMRWASGRQLRVIVSVAVGYWALASIAVLVGSWNLYKVTKLYTWPPIRYGEFLLGVAAALAVRQGYRLKPGAAVVFAIVGLAIAYKEHAFPAADVGAAFVFLAVIMLAVQSDIAGKQSWLTSNWMVYLGRLSFSLYLVHEPVMLNLSKELLSGWTPAERNPVLIVASLAAAVLLHHGVERPCERRIRSLRLGRRPVAATRVPVDG